MRVIMGALGFALPATALVRRQAIPPVDDFCPAEVVAETDILTAVYGQAVVLSTSIPSPTVISAGAFGDEDITISTAPTILVASSTAYTTITYTIDFTSTSSTSCGPTDITLSTSFTEGPVEGTTTISASGTEPPFVEVTTTPTACVLLPADATPVTVTADLGVGTSTSIAVPACATLVTFEVAGGGTQDLPAPDGIVGGDGGIVSGTVDVTAGDILELIAGGIGLATGAGGTSDYGSGGNAGTGAAGGGGASALSIGNELIAVGGGGGGQGAYLFGLDLGVLNTALGLLGLGPLGLPALDGTGNTGDAEEIGNGFLLDLLGLDILSVGGGQPGTATAVGAGGTPGPLAIITSLVLTNGRAGQVHDGGDGVDVSGGFGSGGGGGGYFGGGGGSALGGILDLGALLGVVLTDLLGISLAGGGGGGSNFILANANVTDSTPAAGAFNPGAGSVTITFS